MTTAVEQYKENGPATAGPQSRSQISEEVEAIKMATLRSHQEGHSEVANRPSPAGLALLQTTEQDWLMIENTDIGDSFIVGGRRISPLAFLNVSEPLILYIG